MCGVAITSVDGLSTFIRAYGVSKSKESPISIILLKEYYKKM